MRKKIMLLFIINIMMVSIAGCGKKEENSNMTSSTQEKQVIETETQNSTEETVSDTKENTQEVSSDKTTKQQSEESYCIILIEMYMDIVLCTVGWSK